MTAEFKFSASELRGLAEAISGHDRALQNVREEIAAFSKTLGALVEDQRRLASGLENVAETLRLVRESDVDLRRSTTDLTSTVRAVVPDLARTKQMISEVRDGFATLRPLPAEIEALLELIGSAAERARRDGDLGPLADDAARSADRIGTSARSAVEAVVERTSQIEDKLAGLGASVAKRFDAMTEALDGLDHHLERTNERWTSVLAEAALAAVDRRDSDAPTPTLDDGASPT